MKQKIQFNNDISKKQNLNKYDSYKNFYENKKQKYNFLNIKKNE